MTTPEDKPTIPLSYASASTKRPRRAYLLLGLAVGIVLGGILLYGVVPRGSGLVRTRATENGVKCGANLRQIGQAMLGYATLHLGRFPDRIGELQALGVPMSAFICPQSNDEVALPAATTQATADNIEAAGHHLSYIYLAKGLTFTGRTDQVLVCEPLSNHSRRGINVLFGDGHVEWFQSPVADWVLSEIQSGHNPPRFGTAPKL